MISPYISVVVPLHDEEANVRPLLALGLMSEIIVHHHGLRLGVGRHGGEVTAVVPRRAEQAPVEDLDGIRALGFSPWAAWAARKLLIEADADVYYLCELSLATWLALGSMPDRKHIVTFRDPRDARDWRMEFDRPSLHKLQVLHNYLYENNVLVRRSVRGMDRVFTIGNYRVPEVRRMYGIERDPAFLPTPAGLPKRVRKAATPTVCYLARMDRRKRPTVFLDLAERFPNERFVAVGKSRDPAWEAKLRRRYGHLPNLEMVSFVDQFASDRHSRIREESWVMVNPATREALPNACLESAAHGCAILSSVDPDGFASEFGYHAEADDFEAGLRWLLEDDRWRERAERVRRYVRETFAMDRAMERHLAVYREITGERVLAAG